MAFGQEDIGLACNELASPSQTWHQSTCRRSRWSHGDMTSLCAYHTPAAVQRLAVRNYSTQGQLHCYGYCGDNSTIINVVSRCERPTRQYKQVQVQVGGRDEKSGTGLPAFSCAKRESFGWKQGCASVVKSQSKWQSKQRICLRLFISFFPSRSISQRRMAKGLWLSLIHPLPLRLTGL